MFAVSEMEMLPSPILPFFLGNLLGFISGFLPGFHPNLIKELKFFDIFSFSIFLISLGTAYNFSQAILACSSGYRVYGYIIAKRDLEELIKSGLLYSFLITMLFPVFYLLRFSNVIKPFIPSILFLTSTHLILRERWKKASLVIFLSSGIVGFLVLRFSLCKNPLLPLLSGMFGIPLLFKRDGEEIPGKKPGFLPTLLASLLMVSLPSFSPVQASIIISDIFKENVQAVVGAVNFSQVISSIYSWFFINKPREGYLEILRGLERNVLGILVTTFILSNVFSYILYRTIGRYFMEVLKREFVKRVIIILNALTVLYFSGIPGILILISSYLIGRECMERKVSQIHCMGCLVIPTLFWYWD